MFICSELKEENGSLCQCGLHLLKAFSGSPRGRDNPYCIVFNNDSVKNMQWRTKVSIEMSNVGHYNKTPLIQLQLTQ